MGKQKIKPTILFQDFARFMPKDGVLEVGRISFTTGKPGPIVKLAEQIKKFNGQKPV